MSGAVGFAVAAALDPAVSAAVAPEVERLGYRTLWANDGLSYPGLPHLAAAQRAAARIRVGVGVIPLDARPVQEIVATAKDLGIDLGRAIVGVGSGRAEHPVDVVRAAVRELRVSLGQGAVIAIAALGPRMCRLAGEVADVVLLNWMTPERIGWARDRIAEGERRAGRAAGSVTVASYVRVALGPDAAGRLAAEAARYARQPSYAPRFAAMGVEPGRVGIASERGDDVRAALRAYRAVLDETVVRALPASPDAAAVLEIARASAP